MRAALGLAAGGFASVGALAAFDYQTCHRMRRMTAASWRFQDTIVRFRNAVAAPLMSREYTLDELSAFDGRGERQCFFAAGGRVYDVSESETFRTAYGLVFARLRPTLCRQIWPSLVRSCTFSVRKPSSRPVPPAADGGAPCWERWHTARMPVA